MKPGTFIKVLGAVGIVGTVVAGADFGPLVTKISLTLTTAANSLAIMFARQNNVTSEQACPDKIKL